MMELADMQDLGSCAERRVGSSPTNRIRYYNFSVNLPKGQQHLNRYCCFFISRLVYSACEGVGYISGESLWTIWVKRGETGAG